jgi:two-component system, LytTR family, sensor kinase
MIQNYRCRTYYLLFAVFFAILWFLFKLGGIPDFKQAIPSTLIDVMVCMASLLFSVEYLLPKYAYQDKYSRFVISFLLLILLAGSCIILAQLALLGTSIFSYRKMIAKYQDHYLYWFWSDLVFGSYFLVAFISTVGCGIRLAFDKLVAERKVETLGKEKIQAELMALKDQINPHFLFNALNTIYYQIDKANLGARETLEQFSSLLRYQLYECDHDEVPIEREAEFLLNYIAMQRQRFDGSCKIKSDGLSEIKGFKIPPYLLSPLVENCFKHVSRVKGSDSFINIKCHCHDDWFELETTNNISKKIEKPVGGIGLNNVRKRLALSYPDNEYALSVHSDNEIFKLVLKLKISWN